eukprot:scaffold68919_cov16-Tisochrysis_lutea.AAC.1
MRNNNNYMKAFFDTPPERDPFVIVPVILASTEGANTEGGKALPSTSTSYLVHTVVVCLYKCNLKECVRGMVNFAHVSE